MVGWMTCVASRRAVASRRSVPAAPSMPLPLWMFTLRVAISSNLDHLLDLAHLLGDRADRRGGQWRRLLRGPLVGLRRQLKDQLKSPWGCMLKQFTCMAASSLAASSSEYLPSRLITWVGSVSARLAAMDIISRRASSCRFLLSFDSSPSSGLAIAAMTSSTDADASARALSRSARASAARYLAEGGKFLCRALYFFLKKIKTGCT
jgi:hypothetical protein